MLPRIWSMHTLRDTNLAPGPTFLHPCSWSQRADASPSTTDVSAYFCELVTPAWLSGVPVTAGPWVAPPHANSSPVAGNERPKIIFRMFMVSDAMHTPYRFAQFAA